MGTCAQGSVDTDGNPGAFKLADLGYGSYRLIETKPPVGYILDATPRTITISSQGQVVALGKISNRKSAVPAIPFTGGERGRHLPHRRRGGAGDHGTGHDDPGLPTPAGPGLMT